jgi:hypothetical protein
MHAQTAPWLYDNMAVWIDMINQSAVSHIPTLQTEHLTMPESVLTGTTSTYEDNLHAISSWADGPEYLMRESLFLTQAFKKWRLTASDYDPMVRAQEAVVGFLARNRRARDEGDSSVPACYRRRMKLLLSRWLPQIDCGACTGRFGPGAVAERLNHRRRFTRLSEWYDAAASSDGIAVGHGDVNHVTARLCAVPKDWNKDRLITVEPCFGSFAQQWVRSCLLESIHAGPLRGTAMDLGYTDGQARQRQLAVKASKYKHLATIDLRDGSDNITWRLITEVMPLWVIALLESTRSCAFEYTLGTSKYREDLYIFAGMGNATTFVVETLVFSAWIVAFEDYHRGHFGPGWVSTFGDDIICHSSTAQYLIQEDGFAPFFRINTAKSFYRSDDHLREACGIFAYDGKDITAPRIHGWRGDYGGRLAVANLHRRLLDTYPGQSWTIMAHLIASHGCIENWPFLVEGYPSISDWSAPYATLPELRWNPSYQRREAKVTVDTWVGKRYPAFRTPLYPRLARSLLDAWYLGMVRLSHHRGRWYWRSSDEGRQCQRTRWAAIQAAE